MQGIGSRSQVSVLALATGIVVAVGGCGGDDPKIEDASGGNDFRVSARASFDERQDLARTRTLRITVRNEEQHRTLPDVAVVLKGLQRRIPAGDNGAGRVADPRRPIWVLDEPPDVVTWSKKFQLGGLHLRADFLPAEAFRLFNTFLGDPLRAAQAEIILDVVARDGLIEHTRNTGATLVAGLNEICARYPGLFSAARGAATFAAVDVRDAPTRDRILDAVRQIGLEAGGSGERSIRFRPALVFGDRHVAEAMARLDTVAQRTP